MDSIIIAASDEEDMILLKTLAKKMGLKNKVLTQEEQEDLGLIQAMAETADDELVPLAQVMKALDE